MNSKSQTRGHGMECAISYQVFSWISENIIHYTYHWYSHTKSYIIIIKILSFYTHRYLKILHKIQMTAQFCYNDMFSPAHVTGKCCCSRRQAYNIFCNGNQKPPEGSDFTKLSPFIRAPGLALLNSIVFMRQKCRHVLQSYIRHFSRHTIKQMESQLQRLINRYIFVDQAALKGHIIRSTHQIQCYTCIYGTKSEKNYINNVSNEKKTFFNI